jgi:DNA polymerase-3 subunit beta
MIPRTITGHPQHFKASRVSSSIVLMKFFINRTSFTAGLNLVRGIAPSNHNIPVLTHVFIEATGTESIRFTTSNIDLGLRANVKGRVVTAGSICVPVKRLSEIVAELPNEEVSFEELTGGRLVIKSGGSIFRLSAMKGSEFPAFRSVDEEAPSTKLAQADLKEMLTRVSYASSNDQTRFILNGVFMFAKGNSLTCVATDGRRLARVAKELMGVNISETGSIIPAKTIQELLRNLGKGKQCQISFTNRLVALTLDLDDETIFAGPLELISKVVEGKFPDFQRVIPKMDEFTEVKFNREEFLGAIERSSLVCSDKHNSVSLSFSANEMVVTAKSPDFGDAREQIAIGYSGAAKTISFNPEFLIQPLRAISFDEVSLFFKDAETAGVVRCAGDCLCVVMPVRPDAVA